MRLSLYLRRLELFAGSDQETVSSRRLGSALGLTDAQVRKDLACFGQFGRPGVGYQVQKLIAQIKKIMGTDRRWPTAIVGIGNMGQALATYGGFQKRGFDIAALFDTDSRKVGQRCAGLKIHGMDRLPDVVKSRGIKIGIIAVPAFAAQEVAGHLTRAGVRGIMNFAPVMLALADHIALQAVDMAIQLEQLAFKLNSGGAAKK
ncbi:MAG: redox-sensing transcriptional repressor Rex [Planctomycetes bacterium]|nr:redox-sensing transcriptional repressor Rex [Planctomycetota bacterium]